MMIHTKWAFVRIIVLLFAISFFVSCHSSPYKTECLYEQTRVPAFWKSTVADVGEIVNTVKRGEVKTIARSPGGRPIYLVSYGAKQDFHRQANYHSATGARDPKYYADKADVDPPVVYIVGPVHGQEMENVVGTLNLIQVAETGRDFRGKAWPRLKQNIDRCRLLIVPLGNPDGRARCPYDSFVGVPGKEMTRVGQGTRKDGTLYGWPGAKAVHPMQGDVGFLGAYFNDDGINQMHDDFFDFMAKETKAILDVAREEAPDYILDLHSHENEPVMLSTAYVPQYCKEIEYKFGLRLRDRYHSEGLPGSNPPKPSIDGAKYPPSSFNLGSALHHACGGLSLLFECCHGVEGVRFPAVTHDQILDIELILFDELLRFAVEKPRVTMHEETKQ